MITVFVNGKATKVLKNTKVLHACTKAGYPVPHLCYHEDLPAFGNCGVCMVEINGRTVRACSTPCEDGMQIKTTGKKLLDLRREAVEIILSNHPNNCPECIKNGRCELQDLAQELAIRHMHLKKVKRKYKGRDESSPSITLDPSYCVQCGRCTYVCNEVQDVHALQNSDRGFETYVGPTFDRPLESSECVKCGQCSAYCPVAAIYECDDSDPLWVALDNPDLVLVAQEAPAVRVALGEEFGYKPGTNVKGKMYSALRELGFKYVFDTNFGADLTIMEEASEFVHIFTEHPEKFPLITTCCPSWVDYLEKFHSDLIPQFSSSKSPHQMVGTMVKTYWAEKMGIDPNKIFLVSVMPCTAKKYEIERMEDMYASGRKDVDLTITTRELARMLKTRGIDMAKLEEGHADNPLGEYSGAGTIFGATGGVMEAALRTAYKLATGEELPNPKIDFVRGSRGIKKGTINLLGKEIRIGVASGLGNVSKLMNEIREAKQAGKEPPYHFVEVMACSGGCVGGGGQPYRSTNRVRSARAKGLYKEDELAERRESHNNESILNLYKEYLGAPNSDRAKKLLHTKYIARPVKIIQED
ncbi:MAG: NADH-dependent [FeFe] hydrogenase, group A6 [Candidatus Cloacimonetes bacterium]|jgi:NADH-quinone oxidoreductase subunit G|nr:NADH-dependent [FeFe] hydrogenase, group A6 [Candidatus Cloacimonadota bacterium]MDD2505722.1 NADH-dependent [FeFe] hydrogenase, group A6 [Candidatus Cloacimonadota bacterium]MDD4559144.1 NADH-dependent [FeFe] hydrogenase, group A6 [Candidatus Cloacimonadota bacterium]